jgi:hypothetical protein
MGKSREKIESIFSPVGADSVIFVLVIFSEGQVRNRNQKSGMTTNEEASDLAVGQLEEEARRRKERLRALRSKLQGGGKDKEEDTRPKTTLLPRF